MTKCPRCGGPGGVALFTSVAPCDRCLSPAPRTFIAYLKNQDGMLLAAGTKFPASAECVTFRVVMDGHVASVNVFNILGHMAGHDLPPCYVLRGDEYVARVDTLVRLLS